MITFTELTKRYGNLTAVDRLILEVPDGEIFGLLGPNGAGKTTTLKMASGVILPTAGRIIVNGRDVVSEPEAAKSQIGFIPDEPYVYPKLTGREFLEFVCDLFKIPRSEQAGRIDRVVERFRFRDIVDRRAGEYSRGMRQKLAIMAALVHEPRVLLVDEPVVGLDPATIRLVKDAFRELAHSKGVTILLSTHTLPIAEELCDRLGILHHGRLVALGTLAELRHRAHREQATLEELYLSLAPT